MSKAKLTDNQKDALDFLEKMFDPNQKVGCFPKPFFATHGSGGVYRQLAKKGYVSLAEFRHGGHRQMVVYPNSSGLKVTYEVAKAVFDFWEDMSKNWGNVVKSNFKPTFLPED